MIVHGKAKRGPAGRIATSPATTHRWCHRQLAAIAEDLRSAAWAPVKAGASDPQHAASAAPTPGSGLAPRSWLASSPQPAQTASLGEQRRSCVVTRMQVSNLVEADRVCAVTDRCRSVQPDRCGSSEKLWLLELDTHASTARRSAVVMAPLRSSSMNRWKTGCISRSTQGIVSAPCRCQLTCVPVPASRSSIVPR